jgi:ABC-type polysaccharide/polyol phosphate export permease
MALGLVINKWDFLTILFIVAAVLFMAGLRTFLSPLMIDLRDISEHD